MQSLCDISWGFRPEFSFLEHRARKSSGTIFLIRARIRRGREPLSRARDEAKSSNDAKSNLLVSKQLTLDFDFENKCDTKHITYAQFHRNYQPVEEPWILESKSALKGKNNISVDLKVDTLIHSTFNLGNAASFYPVEEPWLFQSSLVPHDHDHDKNINISKNGTPVESESESQNQHTQIADLLRFGEGVSEAVGNNTENEDELDEVPENDESKAGLQDSVTKVILINSSLCTMQRIAVIEDEKLVEILLEPVKDNVQSDSVYLGIVTKFVPHMGGAFVNIGCSRPSLMDTNHNWEPYIFPPFRRHIKQRKKQAKTKQNVEEHDIIENSVQTMLEYNAVHDMNDEFDVVGSAKEVNSKIRLDQATELAQNSDENKWGPVQKGTKIIVQVVKEGLGTKGPTLTAYPKLRSRFWVLMTRYDSVHISKKISGLERTRLRVIAKTLQPPGFGLTVRTVAAGHTMEELQKDLDSLLLTWNSITELAKSAALAADEGVEGATPVMLHGAMGQTRSVVQDLFNDKVKTMVVDSPVTYHEVTSYLQEIAPDLCERVELYTKKNPLFDEYNIENELNNMLSKRVPLSNGGYLVIEQTEALVSVDVNGGQCMLGHGTSQQKAILDVNLAAAKQIAREIRLRDIGGIIVVDFIDMLDDSNKRLVYEEVKKAVIRDRSMVKVSELSRHGLMEITRKRVRPSVTFMISEPCSCCQATGRVEALETSYSKIEHELCRSLALMERADPGKPKSWPKFILRVDKYMCSYLTSGKKTKLAILSSSLKVWILLKVARSLTRGAFELKPLTEGMDHGNDDGDEDDRVVMPSLQSPTPINTSRRKITIFPIKKWKTRGK
ncbi:ribonuclease E/G-like protein, chloroplastic isoform X1 [Tanacetum coccineum]